MPFFYEALSANPCCFSSRFDAICGMHFIWLYDFIGQSQDGNITSILSHSLFSPFFSIRMGRRLLKSIFYPRIDFKSHMLYGSLSYDINKLLCILQKTCNI